jgi:hypothetical protein
MKATLLLLCLTGCAATSPKPCPRPASLDFAPGGYSPKWAQAELVRYDNERIEQILKEYR